jgi:4-nitrophenyl phosphatase
MEKISERLDALVCDLDGVVYRGEEPVEGASAAIERLRGQGVDLLFCTNNSRPTAAQYAAKLDALGISVEPGDILTSGAVTAATLEQRGLRGARAFIVGGGGIVEELGAVGIEPVEGDEGRAADVVVVGWDPGFTWDKMRIAATAVRAGAFFIATNSDATFPSSEGLWPGAGSILASIETASGARAEVMGKPNRPMMEEAARRLRDRHSGVDLRIGMVGDRNDTDLEGGRTMGWETILVLSGVTTEDEATRLDPRPDLVVPSLAALQ